MVKSKGFGDQLSRLESLALPHTSYAVLGFVFFSVPQFPSFWNGDDFTCIMGLVWAVYEIMGVKCLVRSQVLAIFIIYHNAKFLNKVHLLNAPLNPISQPQFYYSLYSTQLYPFSNFRFTLQKGGISIGEERPWLSSGSNNWMSIEPLTWLFLKGQDSTCMCKFCNVDFKSSSVTL